MQQCVQHDEPTEEDPKRAVGVLSSGRERASGVPRDPWRINGAMSSTMPIAKAIGASSSLNARSKVLALASTLDPKLGPMVTMPSRGRRALHSRGRCLMMPPASTSRGPASGLLAALNAARRD